MASKVDARSDIYSTGCLLYELLTGRPPFVGDSPVAVAYQHVREEPPPPSMLDPEVSPVADAITLKALQKKPLDRYQSAGEMREDIERGLSGQQVTAPVVPVDATARFLPPEDNDPRDARPANDWGPHDDEDEGPDRGRKIAYAMLAVAILFVLGVAAFIGLRAFGNANPDTLSAPTLVGSTPAEAEAILARNKLRLGQTEMAASETVPKGEIISQDPRAGRPGRGQLRRQHHRLRGQARGRGPRGDWYADRRGAQHPHEQGLQGRRTRGQRVDRGRRNGHEGDPAGGHAGRVGLHRHGLLLERADRGPERTRAERG